MAKTKNIDMCSGHLMKNMIRYTIPIILTNFLQLLYNAADLVVIGQFDSHDAFAAVGATGSLYNLFVTLFVAIAGAFTRAEVTDNLAKMYRKRYTPVCCFP